MGKIKELLDIHDVLIVKTKYGEILEISQTSIWDVEIRSRIKTETVPFPDLDNYYDVSKFTILKTMD
jgi:hypothetical protein